jgi:hypothetical protein
MPLSADTEHLLCYMPHGGDPIQPEANATDFLLARWMDGRRWARFIYLSCVIYQDMKRSSESYFKLYMKILTLIACCRPPSTSKATKASES